MKQIIRLRETVFQFLLGHLDECFVLLGLSVSDCANNSTTILACDDASSQLSNIPGGMKPIGYFNPLPELDDLPISLRISPTAEIICETSGESAFIEVFKDSDIGKYALVFVVNMEICSKEWEKHGEAIVNVFPPPKITGKPKLEGLVCSQLIEEVSEPEDEYLPKHLINKKKKKSNSKQTMVHSIQEILVTNCVSLEYLLKENSSFESTCMNILFFASPQGQVNYVLNEIILKCRQLLSLSKPAPLFHYIITEPPFFISSFEKLEYCSYNPLEYVRPSWCKGLVLSPHSLCQSPHPSANIIRGDCIYFHYGLGGVQDRGWGCAYRSLQTILSWFALQGLADPPPKIVEIQRKLFELDDRPVNFIGSREWIGAVDIGIYLNSVGIDARICNYSSGTEVRQHISELCTHFAEYGTPLMIGGNKLSYTLLGAYADADSGESYVLVLDPHFAGASSNVPKLLSGGWCAWKSVESILSSKVFYNICFPSPQCGK